ncbi:hypothetical protein SAMN05216268_11935 [Streptomyces yunnanensis]|uniref:Uncharacterized protein n=1 Tax=Streptomyces yunnanensis TaxID=156453 RepID=A0A9X8N5I6_9ACTN|nr:hypothetical protein SAMN05216268_11935 [Streptomyces yunnanensis]
MLPADAGVVRRTAEARIGPSGAPRQRGGVLPLVPLLRGRIPFPRQSGGVPPYLFDIKKLSAFNGEYIRALPMEEFIKACEPWLRAPYAN